MVADYSSKSKWENIGNKGLGFRSLLSWCDCIKIKSNGYCISFSEKIAHDFLLSKTDATDILDQGLGYTQEDIETINIEEEYEEGTVCFPILGIPKIDTQNEFICIEDTSKEHWITEIELQYKDNQDILSAIEFQLSENGLNNSGFHEREKPICELIILGIASFSLICFVIMEFSDFILFLIPYYYDGNGFPLI